MRKINVLGTLFEAWVKEENCDFRRIYERDILESVGSFAKKVYEDLENEFPEWQTIDVYKMGDNEGFPIIECARGYEDENENEFFIIPDN